MTSKAASNPELLSAALVLFIATQGQRVSYSLTGEQYKHSVRYVFLLFPDA